MPEDRVAQKWLWRFTGNLGKKIEIVARIGGEAEPDHLGEETVEGILITICECEKDRDAYLLRKTVLAGTSKS